jgi:hypothetical protein
MSWIRGCLLWRAASQFIQYLISNFGLNLMKFREYPVFIVKILVIGKQARILEIIEGGGVEDIYSALSAGGGWWGDGADLFMRRKNEFKKL